MDLNMTAVLIAGGAALGVIVWVLAKIGHALIKMAEALAAAAAVVFALWLVIKAVLWALRQTVTHWRTSLTVVVALAWCQRWGWVSLALTAVALAGVFAGWRLVDLRSFDAWAGRHLRAWWLRWTVYARSCPTGCTPAGWASNTTHHRSCSHSLPSGAHWAAAGARFRRSCPKCSGCARERRGIWSGCG